MNCLAGQLKLTAGTDYEKEIKIHDWICQNISYDDEVADRSKPLRIIASHNIFGVFAYHRAQCEGIAKAVKVLLNAVNVRCIVVTGGCLGASRQERQVVCNLMRRFDLFGLDYRGAWKLLMNDQSWEAWKRQRSYEKFRVSYKRERRYGRNEYG